VAEEMRLFQPIDVGGLALRNRLMMTVHGPRLSPERYLRYLHERSRDVGLVGLHAMYGVMSYPAGPGRFVPGYASDFDLAPPHPLTAEGRAFYDAAIPTMRAQGDVVHANGAKTVGQVLHLGTSRHDETFQPVIAPSVVIDEYRRNVPHALTGNEIADLVAAFAEAGERGAKAGFDAIEVHGAHGYLVNQFLSPRTNRRDDVYGGSFDNRVRFLIEILDGLRGLLGAGFPIGVRIPGSDLVEGGLTVDDMCAIGRRLEQWGVAYLNVSGGNYTGLLEGVRLAYVAPHYVAPSPNAEYAAAIKQAVDHVPVIVAGRINDLAYGEALLAAGSADMIGLTRALIADSRIVEKVRTGRAGDITYCTACNECHLGRPVTCAVNPFAGREAELDAPLPSRHRRVLVVGGGPAGMQCAKVAAARGHHVRLVDEAVALGGMLRIVGSDPSRSELARYVSDSARQLRDADIDIELGRRVTADDVRRADVDVVVIATGSVEWVPPVPGVDRASVVTSLPVLQGEVELGAHVVVVGGLEDHLPPLTMADFIARAGRVQRVTLISELLVPGEAVEAATLFTLTKRLLENGVDLVPMAALHEVGERSVVVRNPLTNATRTIEPVDNVVLACGRRPRRELADELASLDIEVHVIGDALSPRRVVHANLDGARQAVSL
jgi:2,4-dienoyl-CoA reductase-like NADH-dependent reductase (Old Yellow Enzyme family)/thioredoxin reductase